MHMLYYSQYLIYLIRDFILHHIINLIVLNARNLQKISTYSFVKEKSGKQSTSIWF